LPLLQSELRLVQELAVRIHSPDRLLRDLHHGIVVIDPVYGGVVAPPVPISFETAPPGNLSTDGRRMV